MSKPKPCPCYDPTNPFHRAENHGPALEPHTCPYSDEMGGSGAKCECCEKCTHQCAMDI